VSDEIAYGHRASAPVAPPHPFGIGGRDPLTSPPASAHVPAPADHRVQHVDSRGTAADGATGAVLGNLAHVPDPPAGHGPSALAAAVDASLRTAGGAVQAIRNETASAATASVPGVHGEVSTSPRGALPVTLQPVRFVQTPSGTATEQPR